MKPFLIIGHSRPLSKILFNLTGDILFSACIGGRLCAWNSDDGTLLKRYKFIVNDEEIEKAIWHFDITLDGEKIVVASAAGIFIFDVCLGTQLHYIPLDAVCRSVEWNKKPDDQTMFLGARDSFVNISMAILVFRLVRQNEREYCEQILEITDFTSVCVGASWGPFDETIISWHDDGTIYTWRTETGERIAEAKYFQSKVSCVEFSPDRTFCLCSSLDKTAKLLFTTTLDKVQEYFTDRPLNTCSLSPLMNASETDKKKMHILVAGGQHVEDVTTTKTQEGKTESILIHLITAEILGVISGHFSPVNTISFKPDGKGFATGAVEGNIRIYNFDPSYYTDFAYA